MKMASFAQSDSQKAEDIGIPALGGLTLAAREGFEPPFRKCGAWFSKPAC